MSTTIIMPQLGESVAEGVIGKWLKQEGDHVDKDEPIVEVITDKVNAEIPSPVAGVLERIAQPEGATVAVGEPIGVIGDGGGQEEVSADEDAPAREPTSAASVAEPETAAGESIGVTGQTRPEAPSSYGNGRPTAVATAPTPTTAPAAHDDRSDRVRSSPLVRRLAEEYGVSLAEVPGTGIGGRVSKQDILAYVEQREKAATATPAAAAVLEREPEAPAAVAPPPIAAPPPSTPPARAPQPEAPRPPGPREERITLSPLRKIIAERMAQSVYTIPHAMTNVEVDMTNVVRYRDRQKEAFSEREGQPLSLVAFVVKTTVEALKEFPMVNAEWAGDAIILKHDININIAVDAPDGLITPVIHHADERSLAGLSKAINDLALRARDKKLKVEDMQGGTFTVNNTGALGSMFGFSIINYPQAGILSAASIVKRPVVLEQDGQDLIAVRHIMNLGLSFDHRVLDGGSASGFLNSVKQKLENWRQDFPLY